MNTRVTSWICLAAGIAGVVGAAVLTWQFLSSRGTLVAAAKQEAREEAREAAQEITKRTSRGAAMVESIAGELSSGALTRQTVVSRFREAVRGFPALRGAGVAYARRSDDRLDGAYLILDDGSQREIQLAELGDYTAEPWYADAIANGGGWREPFQEQPGDILTTRYSAPFFETKTDGSEVAAGVVFFSAKFAGAERLFDVFSSSARGWGLLLSNEGYLLVHPETRLVQQRYNISDVLKQRNDPELTAAVQRALGGQPEFIESVNNTTGQSSWFLTEPVGETGWTVIVVRIIDEVLPQDTAFRRSIIQIVSLALAGIIGLVVWAAITLFPAPERVGVLWMAAILCSLAIVCGVAAIRQVTYNQISEEQVPTVRVQDQTALASFIRSQSERDPSLSFLPTGVYINSVKFTTTREAMVTGYVWQKFPLNSTAPQEPQFLLADSYEPTIEEAYRRIEGDYRVVGWRFESDIRQRMDVSRFPFDHGAVTVRLLPRDIGGKTLLIPDLASYVYTNPAALPGIMQNLEIPGWYLSGSFFDYQQRKYNVDFGFSREKAQETFPELRFNMSVKRNLLDPFIQNFVPIGVVLIMLFAVIVTTTSDVEESKLLGFNPSGTMRITSALFFVTLVSHIQLRNALQTHEVVFLEYSYFTVYLVLMVTALHRFLFLMDSIQIRLVEYRSSLILKLLYWPVIMAAQFAVMVAVFY